MRDFHRPTPIPHTLNFANYISTPTTRVYYQSSLYFASCTPVIVQGMNTRTYRDDNHCTGPTLEGYSVHPFTEIDRVDVLE